MDTMWGLYVARFGQGLTQSQVGERAGVDQATVGRWLKGTKVPTSPGSVAALARSFGRNPLEAFVAAGFLTAEEAGRGLAKSSQKLLAELASAIQAQAVGDIQTQAHLEASTAGMAGLLRMHRAGEILGPATIKQELNRARRAVGLPEISSSPSDQQAQLFRTAVMRMASSSLPDTESIASAYDDEWDQQAAGLSAAEAFEEIAAHDSAGTIEEEQEAPDTP